MKEYKSTPNCGGSNSCGCHCHKPIGCQCPLYNPCPESGICNKAYARYDITGSGPSGSYFMYSLSAQEGELVRTTDQNTLLLAAGYIYYISYNIIATPELNSFFQTVPYIDGSPRLYYATFSPTNSVWRNASAANGFIVDESGREECTLQLRLTFAENTRNIDASGVLSIFPVADAGTNLI